MKLEIKNLTIRYKDKAVFQGLNHTFYSGQIVLLSGDSGSGKTSLLNAINGTIPFYKKATIDGDIWVDGKSILNLDLYSRANKIGTIFQNPKDQIVFSKVDDELVFPLENKNIKPDSIREKLPLMLKNTRLNSTDKTWTLSGGQKQILISEAILAMDQDIILLDEPLASLDINLAEKFMKRLKNLALRENKLIIIAEHRKSLVEKYADQIVAFKSLDQNISDQVNYQINKKQINIHSIDEDVKNVYSARDLSLSFYNRPIFENLNFDIKYGDKLLIEGDNGSGKTSLLNILVGIYKKTSGNIHSDFRLENIKSRIKFKGKDKLKAGLVLQNPDYQLFMPSVEKEININAPDKDFINTLVKHFNIEDLLKRNPLSLSEGQKRIIGFIAILATKPDILILDEPSVGIDKFKLNLMLGAIQIYESLLENQNKKLTLIVVSHDERIDKAYFTKKIIL